MAAKVQLNLEHQVAELRDLQEKKLFSAVEISEIVRKRTAYESSVTRKSVRPEDFLAYAAYETKLEALRRLRAKRLKLEQKNKTATLSDYSIPRHVTALLTIGSRRFPSSTILWDALLDHVQHGILQPSHKQISATFVSAIAALPTSPIYWIKAVNWEAQQGDPSAARKLVMRALRFVGAKEKALWMEWIKLEMRFADNLRKRWEVLGLQNDAAIKGKEKAAELAPEAVVELPLLEGEPTQDVDGLLKDAVGDVEAAVVENEQQPIMDGAIVKVVLDNAIAGMLYICRI